MYRSLAAYKTRGRSPTLPPTEGANQIRGRRTQDTPAPISLKVRSDALQEPGCRPWARSSRPARRPITAIRRSSPVRVGKRREGCAENGCVSFRWQPLGLPVRSQRDAFDAVGGASIEGAVGDEVV